METPLRGESSCACRFSGLAGLLVALTGTGRPLLAEKAAGTQQKPPPTLSATSPAPVRTADRTAGPVGLRPHVSGRDADPGHATARKTLVLIEIGRRQLADAQVVELAAEVDGRRLTPNEVGDMIRAPFTVFRPYWRLVSNRDPAAAASISSRATAPQPCRQRHRPGENDRDLATRKPHSTMLRGTRRGRLLSRKSRFQAERLRHIFPSLTGDGRHVHTRALLRQRRRRHPVFL